MPLSAPVERLPDVFAEALGHILAQCREEWLREVRLREAETAGAIAVLRAENAAHKAELVELKSAARQVMADIKSVPPVTVDDVRPVIEAEITRRLEALPAAHDIPAAVSGEIEGRLNIIAERAAALVPVPVLPDVHAIVENAVSAAFATVRVPEDGKDADSNMIAALVWGEVARAVAEKTESLPNREEVNGIARTVVNEALPVPHATIDGIGPLIEAECAKQIAALPASPDDAAISVIAGAVVESLTDEIARRAAELVPAPNVPDMPDVAAAVEAEISRREAEISARAAALIPDPEPGRTPTADEIRSVVADEVKAQIAELPPSEPGPPGPPGKMPTARFWVDGVYYEGEVVAHPSGSWQAKRDTGREPPHDDWICLAPAGADAPVGEVCGLYDPSRKYRKFDVAAFNGGSWQAKQDDPGPLPGDGWMLSSRQGKPGEKGPKGDRGIQGPPGTPAPTIREWRWRGYEALPVMTDDTVGPPLDMRIALERYMRIALERYHQERGD